VAKPRAAVAFKAHTGWACVVVVVEAKGGIEIVAKQRLVMLEGFHAAAVYHRGHEEHLPAAQAQAIIDAALRTSVAKAEEAVGALARSGSFSLELAAILAGSPRPLPALDAILRSHPLVHAAEGEMYRTAVARACETAGLRVLRLPAKGLQARAPKALGLTDSAVRDRLDHAGRASGRPWTAEQRECALAAWVALNLSASPDPPSRAAR
jgi:hypothetical protein